MALGVWRCLGGRRRFAGDDLATEADKSIEGRAARGFTV